MADNKIQIVIEAVTSGLENIVKGATTISSSLTEIKEKGKGADDVLKNAFQKLNMPDFKAVKAEMTDLIKAYVTLKSSGKLSMQELAIAEENLKRKTDELKKSLDYKPDTDLSKAFKKLDMPDFKAVTAEIKSLESAYATLKSSGKLSMDELYKAKLQLQTKTDELKSSLNDYPSILSNAKAEFAGMAVAVYAAGQAFSKYSEFSHKMNEVNTLIDVSNVKFGELSDVVVEMSTRIPQSAKELAAGLYDLLSSGATVENAPKALEAAAKAAVAGVKDTQTAIRAGLGVINAYGMKIGDLSKIYDTLFQTVKIGVTTFPELANQIGDVLPTARAAGVGLDEVSAAIAQLTKAGVRTPLAVTALTSAIRSLAMPTEETKQKLSELGIKWDGLANTLKKIKELGLSPAEMRGIIPDEEAIKGVLSLTQNFDGFLGTLSEIQNAAGSTEAAYKKMVDADITNQVKLLKNNFEAKALLAKGDEESRKRALELLKETAAMYIEDAGRHRPQPQR